MNAENQVSFIVERKAFKERIQICKIKNLNDIQTSDFLQDAKLLFASKIPSLFRRNHIFNIILSEYSICDRKDENNSTRQLDIKTQPIFGTINGNNNLQTWFDSNIKELIEQDIAEIISENSKSDFYVREIIIMINKLGPTDVCTYFELPKEIMDTKACVNVKHFDNQSFKWAVLSAFYPVEELLQYEDNLNFSGIEFPMIPQQIKKFEKQNDISINLYIYALQQNRSWNPIKITPSYLTSSKKEKHVNLLLVKPTAESEFHYVLIRNLGKLNGGSELICDRCLNFFKTNAELESHKVDCEQINHCKIRFHSKKYNTLKFQDFKNFDRVPFVIYADFECLLKPLKTETSTYQKHEAFSIGYFLHCSYDESLSKYEMYRRKGDTKIEPAEWFVKNLQELARILEPKYFDCTSKAKLTEQEMHEFEKATECYICNEQFSNSKKVRDYCNFTGRYRGPAHENCITDYRSDKIVFKNSRTIPVVFHNLNGYDSHLFIKQLVTSEEFPGELKIFAKTKENYIFFTKNTENKKIQFKFIDSCKFLAASLRELSSSLDKMKYTERVLEKHDYKIEQINLLKKKGIFPYDFVSSLEKLETSVCPSKEDFYSSLMESHISDEDYEHVKKVWNDFNIRTLGDYSDLYLKTDVLLLADVFETFRDNFLEIFKLDPAHYVSISGLAWDAMLRFTKIQLEHITDIDILMFIKRGIRGGINHCCKKYAEANNKYIDEYDENKNLAFIMNFDFNNLYGWAMTQYLPTGGLEWVKNVTSFSKENILNHNDNDSEGYIFEVDLGYPKNIHDDHKDLPFCPEKEAPQTTLCDKNRYVIHYRALKQALEHGLSLKKIHRILKFNQKPWLKEFVEFIVNKRKNARDDFEVQLYKKIINSIYGRSMMNKYNYRSEVVLVNNWRDAKDQISKPNLHSYAIQGENLVAVQHTRTDLWMDTPIYIGFTILDLSKMHVYEFHYNFMKEHVGKNNYELLYTDTDSLMYKINKVDIYQVMRSNKDMFDTSNYPENNKFGIIPDNKMGIGLMKDVSKGEIILKYVGLRCKSYCMKTKDKLIKTAGSSTAIVKRALKFEDYYNCLKDNKPLKREHRRFISKSHELFTKKEMRISLNPQDDKRYLIPNELNTNEYNTLPWGHYKIPKDSKLDKQKRRLIYIKCEEDSDDEESPEKKSRIE